MATLNMVNPMENRGKREKKLTFYRLKVAQIKYVSRNQLHCTAKLNFGLMCKKAKHCWVLSTNFFIYVQLIVFLDHVLLPAELAQKFKLLQNSCMAK